MTKEDKQIIHRYGSFSLILLVMFFSLFIFVRLDRSVWDRGLEAVVNQVLAANDNTGDLTVLGTVPFTSTMASSAAMYLVGKNTVVEGYVIIVRMTGPSGPVSGVFYTKNSQQPPVFLGTADTFSRTENRRINRIVTCNNLQLTTAQISFWSDKAAALFREVLE